MHCLLYRTQQRRFTNGRDVGPSARKPARQECIRYAASFCRRSLSSESAKPPPPRATHVCRSSESSSFEDAQVPPSESAHLSLLKQHSGRRQHTFVCGVSYCCCCCCCSLTTENNSNKRPFSRLSFICARVLDHVFFCFFHTPKYHSAAACPYERVLQNAQGTPKTDKHIFVPSVKESLP